MTKIKLTFENRAEMLFMDGHIVVPLITINDGRTPVQSLPLVFDTGAFITLIEKDKADEYGYKIYKEKACVIAGFSEKGLLCDLRKIPAAVFCNHKIENVIIATPHTATPVTEVLGINILENFCFAVDFSTKEIYTKVRKNFTSQKPRYKCGAVSTITEDDILALGGRYGRKKI